jgi:benzylsuccinate CoA-transferase BbsF subunit|tara:strand:- start:87 stop:1322 length:1236 start_codon:yes stop_codon:yes gene_type:complete
MTQNNQNDAARPLDGYRVLDFGWVLAGALPGMILADMGAEVLKVETRQRMDYMRLGRPIVGDEPDPEQHPLFHNVNRGKLSIALNTTKPEALDLIKNLVTHCDVVVENFSPGVMHRLGLGYDVFSAIKPEIVMASISSNGQTGPLRDLRAYAPSIGALSGLDSTLGYEGERPLGLKHAYADIAGALHSVFAIVSALHQKERTGQGQYIDVSMLRATVATMGAGLMEYEMTGRVMGTKGNFDPVMAPYGNYACQGDDAWVSIAVRTEEEWQGLKLAIGNPSWCEEERFASRYSRLQNRQDLDSNLATWTRERAAGEITELLQANGVAAIPVMGAEDRLFNPHFQERGLYSDIEHPSLGAEPIYNIMWNLNKTPPSILRHAPLLGEHNQQIFGGLLGMEKEEIARLEEDQVLW